MEETKKQFLKRIKKQIKEAKKKLGLETEKYIQELLEQRSQERKAAGLEE